MGTHLYKYICIYEYICSWVCVSVCCLYEERNRDRENKKKIYVSQKLFILISLMYDTMHEIKSSFTKSYLQLKVCYLEQS